MLDPLLVDVKRVYEELETETSEKKNRKPLVSRMKRVVVCLRVMYRDTFTHSSDPRLEDSTLFYSHRQRVHHRAVITVLLYKLQETIRVLYEDVTEQALVTAHTILTSLWVELQELRLRRRMQFVRSEVRL